MRKKKQEKFPRQSVNSATGWDNAIVEARRQIEAAEEKIKRLTLSIQTFEEMRAKGEPFPGEEAAEAKPEAA